VVKRLNRYAFLSRLFLAGVYEPFYHAINLSLIKNPAPDLNFHAQLSTLKIPCKNHSLFDISAF